jgi:hypothetical protein
MHMFDFNYVLCIIMVNVILNMYIKLISTNLVNFDVLAA